MEVVGCAPPAAASVPGIPVRLGRWDREGVVEAANEILAGVTFLPGGPDAAAWALAEVWAPSTRVTPPASPTGGGQGAPKQRHRAALWSLPRRSLAEVVGCTGP